MAVNPSNTSTAKRVQVRTRPNQPGTSLHAWKLGRDGLNPVYAAILKMLSTAPMTDDELHAAYLTAGYPRRSRQRIGTARCELARHELLIDTGERRPSNMGNPARVWAINPDLENGGAA